MRSNLGPVPEFLWFLLSNYQLTLLVAIKDHVYMTILGNLGNNDYFLYNNFITLHVTL